MRKIKSYKDFLNFILLESIIYQTGDFKNFLYYVYDKNISISTKAKVILESLERIDVKTNINYIGISTRSNDELSFIPDTQFQRFISKGDREISLKTKSFASVGRAFRQLLTSFEIPFTDKEIEQFVNEYKSWWDNNYSNKKFEIVKGEEILKWYLEENYTEEKSTLGNSCMRYATRNHFMKLYSDNPDTVSMCVVKEGDKISARALLWTLESGEMLLDRIYYTEDNLSSFVQDNTNKLVNKKLYSHYTGNTKEKMIVNLKNVNYEKFPYADTMIYVYQKLVDGKIEGSGKISNSKELNFDDDFMIIKIQSTAGDPENISHVFSSSKNKWINRKIAIWSGISKDWLLESDFNYSNYLERHIDKDHSVYSEDIKDYIPKEYAINHPEFGLVPKDRIFKIFDGYDGYIEPISFVENLTNGKVQNFKIKEEFVLNGQSIYKISGISFKEEDLVYIESIDESYPKLGCEKVVSISRSDISKLESEGLKFLILDNSNILKIDADILKLSYNGERLYHAYYQVANRIKNSGKKVYINWIQTIEDEDLRQKRLSKLEAYDEYLKDNDVWKISSIAAFEDVIDAFIKTFLNAFDHGDSEKLFNYGGTSNLNLKELINKSLNNFYGRDLRTLDEETEELMIKYYKMMIMIYYITSDSFDSKRFLYDKSPSNIKRKMNIVFGSSDERIEAIRESIKRTYSSIFSLLELSFDIIKENNESLDGINSFSEIKHYLKIKFYSNQDLFMSILDIQ